MPDAKRVEEVLSLIKKDTSKVLGLTVGKHNVTPGQLIPKAEAQALPKLSFSTTTGTYLVIGLDLDAPFPSFSFLSPILHWIQPGLKPSPSADGSNSLELTSSDPFVTDFHGPGPPGISAPHRYVFLLYEQPADFDGTKWAPKDGKKVGIGPRVRYDLGAFEKAAGLGEVLAANYFNSN